MPGRGETLTIDLVPPVIGKDGGKYDKVVVREAKVGEIERATSRKDVSALKIEMLLVEYVCGVPDFVIRDMSMTDFKAAADFINSFTVAGPATTDD